MVTDYEEAFKLKASNYDWFSDNMVQNSMNRTMTNKESTVECRYNAVQYNKILHALMQWRV